jgi:streptogramin lyase
MRSRVNIAAVVGFLLTLEAVGQSATGIFGETRLPTPASQPTEIVVGWDSALWFTEFAANKVAKYYPPTREIIEYVVPTPNSGPFGDHLCWGFQ